MREQIKNGLIWTSLSTVISVVVAMIRVSILTRILEPNAFGLMAIVMIVIGISRLLMDMGVSVAILHKQNISNREYSSLYCFNVLTGIILYVVVLLLTPFVAHYYDDKELVYILPLMGVNILFAVLGLQHKVIERKKLNFKFIEKVEIGSVLLSLIVAVILAYEGFGVYSLVVSSIVQYSFSNTVYLYHGFRNKKYELRLKRKELSPFLKIGGYQTIGQLINYFVGQLDVLITGKILGMSAVGGYNLAKALASRPISFINPVVTKISGPAFASIQENKDLMRKSYLRLVKYLSFVSFPIFVGAASLSSPIIEVFYGQKYVYLEEVFHWLLLYVLIRSLTNIMGGIVVASGRTDLELKLQVLTALCTIIIIMVAAPKGMGFLAKSLFSFRCLYLVLAFYIVIKPILSVEFIKYMAQIIVPLVSSVIMYVVIESVHNHFKISALNILAGITLGFPLYIVLIIVFDRELRDTLKRGYNRLFLSNK